MPDTIRPFLRTDASRLRASQPDRLCRERPTLHHTKPISQRPRSFCPTKPGRPVHLPQLCVRAMLIGLLATRTNPTTMAPATHLLLPAPWQAPRILFQTSMLPLDSQLPGTHVPSGSLCLNMRAFQRLPRRPPPAAEPRQALAPVTHSGGQGCRALLEAKEIWVGSSTQAGSSLLLSG